MVTGAVATRLTSAVLAGILLSTTVAVTGCSSSSSSAGTAASSAVSGAAIAADGQHLAVADFATLLAQPGVVLVDVRTPAEFASGHLDGAKNIDFRAADFGQQIAKLDKQTTYALYCHSGNRSGTAIGQMRAVGVTKVADLAGGIAVWTDAGRPVVTGA